MGLEFLELNEALSLTGLVTAQKINSKKWVLVKLNKMLKLIILQEVYSLLLKVIIRFMSETWIKI